jgi:outer membrane protein TolC
MTRPDYDSAVESLKTAQANVSAAQEQVTSAEIHWATRRSARRSTPSCSAARSTDDLASQVVVNVNSTFRKLEDARDYLKVVELNRDAARAQLQVTMEGFREQTALLKDLLSAQASLAQANDQYRQAVLGFWQARSNFEQAIGAGD